MDKKSLEKAHRTKKGGGGMREGSVRELLSWSGHSHPLPPWDLNCVADAMQRKGQIRSVSIKVKWPEIL